MLWRAGAGGTDLPKEPAMIVMSVPPEKLSLLTSAGQALVPQWLVKFVPADVSTAELKPSQSGSLVASGQGGRSCAGLDQLGQLSAAFTTASQSTSPGQGAQVLPKKPAIFVMSVPSTNPSTGSGATLWRAGARGMALPKEPATIVMSLPSENVSLLRSAGQASEPHWRKGLVPAGFSTAELKPSQSGSAVAIGHWGTFCGVFGQAMQLSTTSATVSPSKSQVFPMQTESLTLVMCSPPKLAKLPVQTYAPAEPGLVRTASLWGEERPRIVTMKF